jgi:uncharacterized repeat protein (TIGR01451 family)
MKFSKDFFAEGAEQKTIFDKLFLLLYSPLLSGETISSVCLFLPLPMFTSLLSTPRAVRRAKVTAAGFLMVSLAIAQVPDAMLKLAKEVSVSPALASHTQNQRIDAIAYTGATQYNTTTHFMTDVFRPWGDTGNFQQVGIVKPEGWIVEAIDSPNYTCTTGEKFGPNAIVCDPEGEYGPLTTENTGMPIRIRFRVVGACGTTAELSSTVANGVVEVKHDHAKSGVTWLGNSPWLKTTFTFPACPTGGNQGGGSQSGTSSYTCDAAGLKQAVQDSKVRFDKVPDGNAFYTWNWTNCRFPVTKATFNILNSTANQSLYHTAHDYIEMGEQKVLWMVRPTTGCVWVQNDLAAGHQTLAQQGTSIAAWENAVNFNSTGVSAYVWGGPCYSSSSSSVAAAMPALTIQKTAQGGTFTPGSTISYTVTVTNVGQGNATNVYIDDNFQEFSALELVSHPNCSTWTSNGKPVLRCILGNLNAGQSQTVNLSFRIPANQPCNMAGQTDKEVVNSAGTTGMAANGTWVTPVWTPYIRTKVSCSNSSSFSSVTWSTGPISSSSSSAFSSVVWSTPSSSGTSSSQSNQQTSLWIGKTVAEQSTKPGQDLHYTVSVKNTGSTAAQNVYFDDVIHPNMFVQSFPAQCGLAVLTNNDTVVRCYLGTLQPNQTVNRDLLFRTGVNYSCGNGAFARNSAFAYASNAAQASTAILNTQVNCNNTSSSVSSVPTGTPNLVIEKSAQNSVLRGGYLTYSIKVTNNGTAPALNTVISDSLPSGVSLHEYPGYPVCDSGLQCKIGSIAAGSSYTLNITVTVHNSVACGAVLYNSASVRADNQSTKYSNTVYTTVNCGTGSSSSSSSYSSISSSSSSSSIPSGNTSLAIYKSVAQTQTTPGQNLNYTVTVQNTGNVAAQNVYLDDYIHPNMFVTSLDTNCVLAAGAARCTIGTLQPGQSVTKSLVYRTDANYPCGNGSVARNSAGVNASNALGATTALIVTPVNCTFSSSSSSSSVNNDSWGLTITGHPSQVQPCQMIDYTIRVTNNSNSQRVTNVQQTIPAQTTFQSASNGGFESNGSVRWNTVTVAANSTVTLTSRLMVSCAAVNGTVLRSNVYVENVSAEAVTYVVTGSTNNSYTVTITSNPYQVKPCETVDYTIRVTNNSNVSRSTTVTQTIPSQTSFQSASDGGYESNGSIRWNNVTINANSTVTLTSRVKVSCSARDGDTIRSTVYVENFSAESLSYVRENGSTSSDKLTISITDNKDPVKPGEELKYSIKICNRDSRDTEVDVNAELDENTTFVSASDDGDDRSDDEVRWRDLEIDRDDCETLTLTVRVKNSADNGDSLKLRVRADGASDTETTKVKGAVQSNNNFGDLRVMKTADRSEANPGDEVSYTLIIRNDTAEDMRNLTITDSFNASQLSIFDPNGGTVTNGTIRWTIDSLDAGQVRTIIYRGRLSSSLRHGDIVRNDVNISGGQGSSNEIRIVTRLPQTGIGDFFSPLSDSSQFLSPMGSSASIPAILWTTIMALGLGAGSMFGRRYFL